MNLAELKPRIQEENRRLQAELAREKAWLTSHQFYAGVIAGVILSTVVCLLVR